MTQLHTHTAWIPYTERRPASEGVCQWRVPSKSLPGETLTFAARFRSRGAGYDTVLSPEFDYWDGYLVQVPAGLEWREHDGTYRGHGCDHITIEGLELSRCPYCGVVPRLFAVQTSSSGGVFVGGDPTRFNSWWMECCRWGRTPHLSDPREIERIRREAFAWNYPLQKDREV